MSCRLFHDWGKWVDVTIHVVHEPGAVFEAWLGAYVRRGEATESDVIGQKRYCDRCGKKQLRKIG